jgi:hypothetical protein
MKATKIMEKKKYKNRELAWVTKLGLMGQQ